MSVVCSVFVRICACDHHAEVFMRKHVAVDHRAPDKVVQMHTDGELRRVQRD